MQNPSYKALAEIYSEDLYIIGDDAPQKDKLSKKKETIDEKPEKEVRNTPEIIGSNKKNILVITDEPGDDFLDSELEELLFRILQSVELGKEDVAICNINGQRLEEFPITCSIMLGFGENTLPEKKEKTELYKISSNDKTKMLIIDRLSVLKDNRQLKTRLWENLKVLFQ